MYNVTLVQSQMLYASVSEQTAIITLPSAAFLKVSHKVFGNQGDVTLNHPSVFHPHFSNAPPQPRPAEAASSAPSPPAHRALTPISAAPAQPTLPVLLDSSCGILPRPSS